MKLSVNNEEIPFLDGFYSFGNPENKSMHNTPLIDVGYGIINDEINEYDQKDVNGKIVIMNEGVRSKADKLSEGNWRNKLKSAEKYGAAAILIKSKDYQNSDQQIKAYIKNPRMKMHNKVKNNKHIPVFIVDERLFSKDTTYTIGFSTSVSTLKTAENVISYIPGKTDETIVISAHYDHIGYDQGEICNGA